MLTVAASGLTLAAVATVYKSWRSQTPAFLYIGLLVWLISTICWSYAQGWEFGLLYALCIPAILVWPFIALNQTVLPEPKNRPLARPLDFSRKQVLNNIGNYLVTLVVLLVVSVLITLALCALMPFSIAGKLATGVVLLPLLWGLFVYHYLATASKLKVLGGSILLAAVSVPVLLLLPI